MTPHIISIQPTAIVLAGPQLHINY